VPYPCSLNVPSLQNAGPMGDQNPMAYVHKGGVRILSYLKHLQQQAMTRGACSEGSTVGNRHPTTSNPTCASHIT
jgi:hypothetical protein